VSAQAEGVASSGMEQGQAAINIRSDIRLGIKGTRATTTDRLEQLTEVVTDQMPALRKCYSDLIAKHPTTVGSIAIRLTLDAGKPPGLELKETGGTEPDLTSCVKRVFEKAPYGKVGRPAAAIATLEFVNTRAAGQEKMQQRMQVSDKVDTRERAGGGFEGNWATNDGKVAFLVASEKSREAVEAALRTLRDGFAGFADCRRRSEKNGLSPAGVLEVDLQLQRGGKGAAKIKSSTVAHERAVPCVERVLKKLKYDGAPPAQKISVQVTFGA
jgi:hypothetical protein